MHPKADEFARLYATGMGVMRIAKRLHIAGRQARKIREELGIEPRPSGGDHHEPPSEALLAAAKLYLEGGISQAAAATQFGVPHYLLRYHLARERRKTPGSTTPTAKSEAELDALCLAMQERTKARVQAYDRRRAIAGGVPW